jgi:hypothetical protein
MFSTFFKCSCLFENIGKLYLPQSKCKLSRSYIIVFGTTPVDDNDAEVCLLIILDTFYNISPRMIYV